MKDVDTEKAPSTDERQPDKPSSEGGGQQGPEISPKFDGPEPVSSPDPSGMAEKLPTEKAKE